MITNSLFNGVKYISSCKSTNSVLNNILKENGDNENIVIRADYQTKGVGQKGAFWESEKGKNLLFSFSIGFNELLAVKQFYLSAIVSLSIVNLLKIHLPNENISIKWPNDIYVGNKKIAGILIENTLFADKIKHSIIGIGININQKVFISDAPNPISLSIISNKNFDIDIILNQFIKEFEKFYYKLGNRNFDAIKDEYLNFLYQKDMNCKYLIQDTEINGIIRGVDRFGFLLMEMDNKLRTFDIKEVKYIN